MSIECPDCGDSFGTERAKNIHNSKVHGTSRITKECENCGEPVTRLKSQVSPTQMFLCDQSCKTEYMQGKTFKGNKSEKIEAECEWCGNELSLYPSRYNRTRRTFCDRSCSSSYFSGERHVLYEKEKHECERCGEIVYRSPSQVGENVYCSSECYHGPSSAERIRDSRKQDIRKWRQEVFVRDDYTCQDCGECGGNLNAHHIKRWKDCPEARFDISNGVTLCVRCHAQRHKEDDEMAEYNLIMSNLE